MTAVIFEPMPHAGRRPDYLRAATALRASLEKIDDFIFVERFESLAAPGKLLSLSFGRDEDAIRRWRNLGAHRAAQSAGVVPEI